MIETGTIQINKLTIEMPGESIQLVGASVVYTYFRFTDNAGLFSVEYSAS